MKTSISPSSELLISLLSLLVRIVCHWVALEAVVLINLGVAHRVYHNYLYFLVSYYLYDA